MSDRSWSTETTRRETGRPGRRPSPGDRIVCPACGRTVKLGSDGEPYRHPDGPRTGRWAWCPGEQR